MDWTNQRGHRDRQPRCRLEGLEQDRGERQVAGRGQAHRGGIGDAMANARLSAGMESRTACGEEVADEDVRI